MLPKKSSRATMTGIAKEINYNFYNTKFQKV